MMPERTVRLRAYSPTYQWRCENVHCKKHRWQRKYTDGGTLHVDALAHAQETGHETSYEHISSFAAIPQEAQ